MKLCLRKSRLSGSLSKTSGKAARAPAWIFRFRSASHEGNTAPKSAFSRFTTDMCVAKIRQVLHTHASHRRKSGKNVQPRRCSKPFGISLLPTKTSQASASNEFFVILPSDSLDEGSLYTFGLRVTTALGGWGETHIEVFKSADTVPALKVWQMCFISIHTPARTSISLFGNARAFCSHPKFKCQTVSNLKPFAAGKTISRRRAGFVLALRCILNAAFMCARHLGLSHVSLRCPADRWVGVSTAVAWAASQHPHRGVITSRPRRQRYIHMDRGLGKQRHHY